MEVSLIQLITEERLMRILNYVAHSHTINKNTSAEELVNVAYLNIIKNKKYWEDIEDENKLISYLITIARTGIQIFYRDNNFMTLPKTNDKKRNDRFKLIDKDINTPTRADGNIRTYNKLESEMVTSLSLYNPALKMENKEISRIYKEEVKKAINKLTNAEVFIIENRKYCRKDEVLSLKVLAEMLGVTTTRVAQIEIQALEKLSFYLRKLKKLYKS